MKEKLRSAILLVVPLSLLFAMVFSLLRVYEFFALSHAALSPRYEALGFLYDLPFTFKLILFVLAVSLIVSLLHVKTARVLAIVLYTLLIVLAFALIQYFSVTRTPLSADLFGYSFQDIKTTVSASGGFSWITVAVLVLYTCLFIIGSVLLAKPAVASGLSLRAVMIMLALIIVMAFLPFRPSHEAFREEIHYNLVVNKSQYFFARSVSYFSESTELTAEVSQQLDVNSYPFLKEVNYQNVLGPFFRPSQGYPHLVFVIVEGLGRDFSGPGALYGGFTPFLDSLAAKSLYWKNGLSNAGRTFGALPSLLGSLPYGKNGFMSYGTAMPDHQTLISLLKAQGYTANFFYGGNPNFDNQDLFLQYQGIDYMLNEGNFPVSYKKTDKDEGGFTWGYADRDVFNRSLEILDEKDRSPRLDIYLTLSTHEPFQVPDKKFDAMFDKQLEQSDWDNEKKEQYTAYKSVFSCLRYTDDAIREFLEKYKQRPEYEKTIFIITGDHRLIPVPQHTKLSRFHVPVIVYSPLLQNPETFQSLVAHSDITPSLLSFLHRGYGMKFPAMMPFISKGLSVERDLSGTLDVALMRNKGEVNDYVDGLHFLSEGRLFEILPDLELEPVTDDAIQQKLEGKLKAFKAQSLFACEQNKVDKVTPKNSLREFTFTVAEEKFIKENNLQELKPDQMFGKAREMAFDKKYAGSRTMLRVLLNGSPNYHDARILLARTFAWDGQYDTARFFLRQVLDRSPSYDDTYNAMADIAFWNGKHKEALALAEKGLLQNPGNAELMARQARGLWMTGRKEEAKKTAQAVLEKSPQNEMASDLLKKLGQ